MVWNPDSYSIAYDLSMSHFLKCIDFSPSTPCRGGKTFYNLLLQDEHLAQRKLRNRTSEITRLLRQKKRMSTFSWLLVACLTHFYRPQTSLLSIFFLFFQCELSQSLISFLCCDSSFS